MSQPLSLALKKGFLRSILGRCSCCGISTSHVRFVDGGQRWIYGAFPLKWKMEMVGFFLLRTIIDPCWIRSEGMNFGGRKQTPVLFDHKCVPFTGSHPKSVWLEQCSLLKKNCLWEINTEEQMEETSTWSRKTLTDYSNMFAALWLQDW